MFCSGIIPQKENVEYIKIFTVKSVKSSKVVSFVKVEKFILDQLEK